MTGGGKHRKGAELRENLLKLLVVVVPRCTPVLKGGKGQPGTSNSTQDRQVFIPGVNKADA